MDKIIQYPVSNETELKIKSKLPSSEIKKLERYLRYTELDNFVNLIKSWDLNYKSINQINQSIKSTINPSTAYRWSKVLIEEEENEALIIIGGILLIKAEIWQRDPEYAIKIIRKYSDYEEWRIRGVGINLLSQCMIKNYEAFLKLFIEFIGAESAKYRRVAISSANEIAVYKGKITFIDDYFLNLLIPYLTENDPYVNSVSNETFGSFVKYYSDLFFAWLTSNLEVFTDEVQKSSILYILSNNHATKFMDQSCKIIDYYITDDDPKVKSARSAALRNLAKYHSKSISNWLEQRMNIPQAVDHWSELEIDGLLDSFIV